MKNTTPKKEVDRRAICPSDSIPILEFYKGLFDSVYVSLNPFLKIKNTSNYTVDNFWENEDEREEKLKVLSNTEAMKWSEILTLSKLKDIKEIDIALRTGIGGLKEQFENKNYLEILESILDPNRILSPNEGSIQEIQQDRILNAINKLGYKTICIGEEFGELIEVKKISDILESAESIYERNLYTEDKKVLITVHWDSFQTYICSSKEIVQKIVQEAKLEGFYCDETTKIYWSSSRTK